MWCFTRTCISRLRWNMFDDNCSKIIIEFHTTPGFLLIKNLLKTYIISNLLLCVFYFSNKIDFIVIFHSINIYVMTHDCGRARLGQGQGQEAGAPNRGGGLGGLNPSPPEFWMGGLNTCQPPLILRKNFLGGVGSP